MGFLEKADGLPPAKAPTPFLDAVHSETLTGIDCNESASSSADDAKEPLLCELNLSRSRLCDELMLLEAAGDVDRLIFLEVAGDTDRLLNLDDEFVLVLDAGEDPLT